MRRTLLLVACFIYVTPVIAQSDLVTAQVVDFSRLGAGVTGIELDPANGTGMFEGLEKIVGRLESLGASRVAAVYTDNEYGREAAAALRRFSAVARIQVTSQVLGRSGGELTSISARVAETDAEAVFVFADASETARFIRKYRHGDPGTPIYALVITTDAALLARNAAQR